jgi:WW domain-containing oxidoreductase
MSEAFGFETTAEEVTNGLDLGGQTWLITGCNSGLGYETARVLGLRGAKIVGAARTEQKAKDALDALGLEGVPLACELSNLASVKAAVQQVEDQGIVLDGIIANAGIMALPELQQQDGIELQFFTNHVGHFVLVTGLLEQLTDTGRVVILSSAAHTMAKERGIELDNLSGETDYHAWRMYGRSKLANILFALSLAHRFEQEGSQRTANSLHPGVIQTNLTRHMPGGFDFTKIREKSIGQGAATQCFVATHPSLAGVSGKYFSDCQQTEPIPVALDLAVAEQLWKRTEEIVASVS